MGLFLNFLNKSSKNTYIKSAITHLWFVTIYPYNDGNGRMARALAHLIVGSKIYSISNVIYKNKKSYY